MLKDWEKKTKFFYWGKDNEELELLASRGINHVSFQNFHGMIFLEMFFLLLCSWYKEIVINGVLVLVILIKDVTFHKLN